MAGRQIGGRFYVYFNWKGNRLQTVTTARNEAEAKKLEKAVKTAFNIQRFDHLEPEAKEWVIRTYEGKGWKLPSELATHEPEKELILFVGIKDYWRPRRRTEPRERSMPLTGSSSSLVSRPPWMRLRSLK